MIDNNSKKRENNRQTPELEGRYYFAAGSVFDRANWLCADQAGKNWADLRRATI